MDNGKEVVVKITRPGTDEAITKNARALEILIEITDALNC
jgi:predicted unusual protein kinase regulating ubiquinone biosynthesis (AarF/ABC1/UbiB family)